MGSKLHNEYFKFYDNKGRMCTVSTLLDVTKSKSDLKYARQFHIR